ncbi:AI-2E family transporter [Bacillus massiliigorillae]|uniref:AI-2E family transporter n=1 Tax=Bacillus massiliigorillae TaxID=1243664 RepID=UPI0003A22746|nr:AI-2E family transporter [Bacillus massiliigorillae]
MELNKHNIKRILLIIALSILMFLGLQNFGYILTYMSVILNLIAPLIIGLCLAFILNVLLKIIEERLFKKLNEKNYKLWNKIKRPVCILLSVGIIAGVIFVLMFQIIPELKKTFASLADQIPIYLDQVQIWADKLAAFLNIPSISFKDIDIDWDSLGKKVTTFLQNDNINFLSRTKNITTSIVSGVIHFLVGIVFSIYILSQKEKLCSQAKRILYAFLPNKNAEYIISVTELSNRIFSRFVTGQFLEAIIIGVLCFIGMTILSMPYSVMISFLVGMTALIPIFGAFIGTAIGAFLILMVEPMQALWFIIFIIVLQRIDGYFIYPKVVGNSVGLPSMWVLFAVLVGGSAFGIIGMLIGVPVFSVIYCLLQQGVANRLKKKGLTAAEIEKKSLETNADSSQ